MSFNRLITITRKVINEDRGIGLQPLLDEFVNEVESLTDEQKKNREYKIASYFKEMMEKTGNLKLAYRKTRTFAMGAFVQHWNKKVRASLGLPENKSLDQFYEDVASFEKEVSLEMAHWTDEDWRKFSKKYPKWINLLEGKTSEEILKIIQNFINIQLNDPLTKKDDYMAGLTNGLILAKSAITGDKDPNFVSIKDNE